MQVQSPGQEDTLEEEIVTHSSILETTMDTGAWQAMVPRVARVGRDRSNLAHSMSELRNVRLQKVK